MALTTGKKQTSVTPSSMANRMGVVPAYGGDWLATASDTLGKTLDLQAKRVATIEEEKWKAQFSIDTYKAINEFAMAKRIDPNGFNETVTPYIEALVEAVPTKYKGWAKQYSGMMAAREGQQIINRHYNIQQQDAIKVLSNDTDVWLSNTSRIMESTDYKDWDQTFVDSHLAELTEKSASYESLYNSLDPQYKAGLPLPEVWKRDKQLKFEGARLNSKHRALLENAALMDQEAVLQVDLNDDNEIYQPSGVKDEPTNVDIAIATINRNLTKYMENPDTDGLDGYTTLLDTTNAERIDLVSNAQEYVNTLKKTYDVEQNKIKNQAQTNYNKNINILTDAASSSYTSYDESTLIKNLNALNATPEDRTKVLSANTKSNIIGKYAAFLYAEEDTVDSITYNGETLEFGKFNKTWNTVVNRAFAEMSARGITGVTKEEIKTGIINQHIYTLTGKEPDDLTFELDFASGVGSEDFDAMVNYSVNMGIVPQPLVDFINENVGEGGAGLNLNLDENIDTLVQVAAMFNVLQNTPTPLPLQIDGVSAENQMLLGQFYADYKNYFDRTANRDQRFISTNDYVKNWWELRNAWQNDESDKIINAFDTRLADIDEDLLEGLMTDYLEKNTLGIFGNNFGTTIAPLAPSDTVEPLIDFPLLRWFKVNSAEVTDLNLQLGVEKMMEVLPDYLVNYYKTNLITTDQIKQRSNFLITQDINDIIGYVMSDLSNTGYGFE